MFVHISTCRINSGLVTESVRFDDLVSMFKNHIHEVEQQAKRLKGHKM
jgi:hypothetical protein